MAVTDAKVLRDKLMACANHCKCAREAAERKAHLLEMVDESPAQRQAHITPSSSFSPIAPKR